MFMFFSRKCFVGASSHGSRGQGCECSASRIRGGEGEYEAAQLFSPRKYFMQQSCSSPCPNSWALCQVLPGHSVPLWTFLPFWYLACLAHSKPSFWLFQKLLHMSRISYNLRVAAYRTPKNSFTKLSVPSFHVFLFGLNFSLMWKERDLWRKVIRKSEGNCGKGKL